MLPKYIGCDISKWQGIVKKAEGVDFCILRIGYSGYKYFSPHIDECFIENYHNLKDKVYIGAYYYSTARTYEEGVKERNFVYKVIRENYIDLDFPIIIDQEEIRRTGTKRGLTDAIKGFCETLEKYNFYVAVYTSESWRNEKIFANELKRYDWWIRNWNKKPMGSYYGMWQYTNKGFIKGIGIVDMSEAYKDYPIIIKKKGLNKWDS